MSGNQMPQQYCLRWNNHQHNLLSVFEDLLNHEAFVDVTLACDGLQLKAHKMVLSACSPYFQSLLYNTPDRHPIVFLRDVRYHEMKALLEFMYRGEVSVDQENLSSLLKVAEGLKIKGLAEVNDQAAAAVAMAAESSIKAPQPQVPTSHAGHLSHFGLHGFPGLLSPHALETAVANSLASKLAASSSSVSPPPSIVSALSVGPSFLGPKRKRGRPRRLSGSEAIPMASGLSENGLNQMDVHTEDLSSVEKMEKGMRDGSGDVSPKDTKPNDLLSEADSIDGRTSGLLSPKREASLWSPHDFSRSTGGLHHQLHHHQQQKHHDEGIDSSPSTHSHTHHPHSPSPSPNRFQEEQQRIQQQQQQQQQQQEQQRRQLQQQDGHKKFKREQQQLQRQQQQQVRLQQQHQQQQHFKHEEKQEDEELRHLLNSETTTTSLTGPRGGKARGRGRRGRHRGDRTGSRSMSEMSVRGLDLLRYATLAPDGTYRCIECERVQISKHFKNKYSFQRHAFLYHEGAARKVFPCMICQKEFSRPDKMKQHLKQAHDCNGGSPGKSSSPSVAAMAAAVSAAVAAGMGSPTLPPSALLVNPFLGLSDPGSMEGKIGSLKDSGARC